jgi:hypothetical protein
MERKKDPGLKPLDSIGFIQGLKPPAPSEKAKTGLLWEKGVEGPGRVGSSGFFALEKRAQNDGKNRQRRRTGTGNNKMRGGLH